MSAEFACKGLFRRHRLALAFLQSFGGCLQKHDLHKLLFLYRQGFPEFDCYDFLPYRRGSFSLQLEADGKRLRRLGILKADEDVWQLVESRMDFLAGLPAGGQAALLAHARKLKNVRGSELTRKVYRLHPYYAINSEVAAGLMSRSEQAAIRQARPVMPGPAFFTIGYEGISVDTYLNRLVQKDVRILCDVRKNPLSRKYGFSKTELAKQLRVLKIEYAGFPELGIDQQKRRRLQTRGDYQKLFADYRCTTLKANQAAMKRLGKIFDKYQRLAITCFEADHSMCHRSEVAAAFAGPDEKSVPICNI